MIEIFVDLLLIIVIICWWLLVFRKDGLSLPNSPCLIENQTFTDPYGLIYKCNKQLIPELQEKQVAMDYEDDKFFDIVDKQVKKRQKTNNLFNIENSGLPTLSFPLEGIEEPFEIKNNKIILNDSCHNKLDGELVALNIREAPVIIESSGSPYGVCRNGKIGEIRFCNKYEIFENNKCVYSNPCLFRRDGYILEVDKKGFKRCENQQVETVICGKKELLIDYKCVTFPCLGEKDSHVIKVMKDRNSIVECRNEKETIVVCPRKSIATINGCIDERCKNNVNGLNPTSHPSQLAVSCKNGQFMEYVQDTMVDSGIKYLGLMYGLSDAYEPFLDKKGRFFTQNGWESLLRLIQNKVIQDVYVPFKLNTSGYHPASIANLKEYVYLHIPSTDIIEFIPSSKSGAPITTTKPSEKSNERDYGCKQNQLYDFNSNSCIDLDYIGTPGLNFCKEPHKQFTVAEYTNKIVYCSGKNMKIVENERGYSAIHLNRPLRIFKMFKEFDIPIATLIQKFVSEDDDGRYQKCPTGYYQSTVIPECIKLKACQTSSSRYTIFNETIIDCLNDRILDRYENVDLISMTKRPDAESTRILLKEYPNLWEKIIINFNVITPTPSINDIISSMTKRLVFKVDGTNLVFPDGVEVYTKKSFFNSRDRPFDYTYSVLKVHNSIDR